MCVPVAVSRRTLPIVNVIDLNQKKKHKKELPKNLSKKNKKKSKEEEQTEEIKKRNVKQHETS